MEVTYFSKTSLTLQCTTQLYNPEDRTLHKQRCENLKYNIIQNVYTCNNSSSQMPVSVMNLSVADADKIASIPSLSL
jgi:hypothetical protein